MKPLQKILIICLIVFALDSLCQITPEAELEYFEKSQNLARFLALNPLKMDSILQELDTLDFELNALRKEQIGKDSVPQK